jgi:cell division protein FtsB
MGLDLQRLSRPDDVMMRARSAAQLIRAAALPAVAVMIVANFAGYAIVGSNGLLAWGEYRRELAEKRVELAAVQKAKAELQHRNALLDPRRVDPDMADEMVRRDLGLVRPDEVVLDIE